MKFIFEKDATEDDKKAFASYLAMEKHLQRQFNNDDRIGGELAHAWFVQDLSAFRSVEDLCGMMSALAGWTEHINCHSYGYKEVVAHVFDAGDDNWYVFFTPIGWKCCDTIHKRLAKMVTKLYTGG